MDKKEVQHPVWIVPVPFCFMWYVNEGRYLHENERPEIDQR